MSLDPGLLEAAIRRKDARAVRDLLSGATEPDRRACAKALKEWHKIADSLAFHLAALGLAGGVAAAAKTPGQTWSQALALLSQQGQLDRGRLIDACLDAFTRDFHPNRVSWYATLLSDLDPAIDEMSARGSKYLGLLAVTSKTAVTVGQAGAKRLLDAGQLDAGKLDGVRVRRLDRGRPAEPAPAIRACRQARFVVRRPRAA